MVVRLRQLRDRDCLDRAHIVAAADGAGGVSDATVYRWLRRADRAPDPARGRFTLSSTDVAALQDFHGRVAAVYRARSAALAGRRRAAGVPIDPRLWREWQGQRAVSRACFYRAVARQWDPAERAYWHRGDEARRARRVWPQRSSPHRNAIWQADHTQLEIVVVPGRGRPLRPWLTTFVDTYSRMIMGWAISERGDAGTVLCALRSALPIDPLRGPHGGVPAVIECDHGADFLSQAVERVASNLVIHVRPVMPRDGRGKGTIEQMLLVAVAGTEDWPGAAMLTLPQLGRLFTEWARFSNHEHHHEGLRGRTPVQVWNGDPTQIDVLDAAQLRERRSLPCMQPAPARTPPRVTLNYWNAASSTPPPATPPPTSSSLCSGTR
ncbi:DDE-type integrase/transposase/recombinase [Amycolatopsis coloradensis]|uniref:DDE-type integrase/transposase/recombinase n=1 Tax=Amycolatopsis coloradensis TaxID=76021 RepID=A0ACD5BHF9_9PSEU